jgi:hypothetical protein
MTLISIVSHIVSHGQLDLIQFMSCQFGKPMMSQIIHSEPTFLSKLPLQELIIHPKVMQRLLWLIQLLTKKVSY